MVTIETPEQIAVTYTVAGVGSRAGAALIDFAICVAVFIALSIIAANVHAVGAVRGVGALAAHSAAWAVAVLLLVGQLGLIFGYYVLFEAIWDGQTPGKRALGLRVVQDGGYSVSFAASAVRNLARLIDMQPGFVYGVGIVSVAVSKSGKRLGDILAGTIVVRERLADVAPMAAPVGPDAAAGPLPVARLSDDEYDLLAGFIARRRQLTPDARRQLESRLAHRLRHALPEARSAAAALVQLAEAERAARGRGSAAFGATGAARERHAIISVGAARWSAFAALLADAQRRGLAAMSDEEVSEFAARYREIATDLARLATAARGRPNDALFYVNRLVGAGHNLLYRQRALSMVDAWRYLTVSVPREIRHSAAAILLAAALLFLPAAITFAVVRLHPGAAARLLPPSMLDRAKRGVAHDRTHHREYVSVSDLERPVMASAIIANNVQVTYAVFVFGITGGVLSVLMLVLNGVSIGAAVGLYANLGIAHQILEFVVPHSPFELSAIAIAGGGGLLLASAILLPGARTRREMLVINGRRAIKLVAASTMLLVAAGTIEGLLSPRTDVPLALKLGVGATALLLLAGYISLGRGAGTGAPDEENAYVAPRALSSR